jgi:hypothetical protein
MKEVQRINSIKGWSQREPQGGCVAKRQRLELAFRVRDDYSDRPNLVENIWKRGDKKRLRNRKNCVAP